MRSGNSLWVELCSKYQEGIDSVSSFKRTWKSLEGKMDNERYESVSMLLDIHEKEAIWWKDASLLYFQSISGMSFPSSLDEPKGTLADYKSLSYPFAPGIRPRW